MNDYRKTLLLSISVISLRVADIKNKLMVKCIINIIVRLLVLIEFAINSQCTV